MPDDLMMQHSDSAAHRRSSWCYQCGLRARKLAHSKQQRYFTVRLHHARPFFRVVRHCQWIVAWLLQRLAADGPRRPAPSTPQAFLGARIIAACDMNQGLPPRMLFDCESPCRANRSQKSESILGSHHRHLPCSGVILIFHFPLFIFFAKRIRYLAVIWRSDLACPAMNVPRLSTAS